MADLLTPYEIKGKTIKNRLVFPPVVCFNYSNGSGEVVQRNIDHYEIMAKGGTGLIIVEATCIDPNGRLSESQLGVWDDSFIEGLAKITEAIHKHGATCLLQIHHAGYKAGADYTSEGNAFTASPYEFPEGRIVRGAEKSEIEKTISDYAKAAVRAQKAGFDGIELHGAHDYLISQFLSADVNKRDDEYGKNRALLALKVIEAVKASVPEDFIVAMRLGANDDSMSEGIQNAKAFEAAGIDLLNISSGHTREVPKDMEQFGEDYHWITQLAFNIKKHVNIPVICVFTIDTPQKADHIVKSGLSDFAASAKGLLSDPFWISKYEKGEEITPCNKCPRCMFYSDGTKCPARKKLQNT